MLTNSLVSQLPVSEIFISGSVLSPLFLLRCSCCKPPIVCWRLPNFISSPEWIWCFWFIQVGFLLASLHGYSTSSSNSLYLKYNSLSNFKNKGFCFVHSLEIYLPWIHSPVNYFFKWIILSQVTARWMRLADIT